MLAVYTAVYTVAPWTNGCIWEGYIKGQYAGIPASGQMGTDGLWARLRGGMVRVMLMLRDSVTGLLWPPVVAEGEQAAEAWAQLFEQARRAGLE